jgi:hypothetical protein
MLGMAGRSSRTGIGGEGARDESKGAPAAEDQRRPLAALEGSAEAGTSKGTSLSLSLSFLCVH